MISTRIHCLTNACFFKDFVLLQLMLLNEFAEPALAVGPSLEAGVYGTPLPPAAASGSHHVRRRFLHCTSWLRLSSHTAPRSTKCLWQNDIPALLAIAPARNQQYLQDTSRLRAPCCTLLATKPAPSKNASKSSPRRTPSQIILNNSGPPGYVCILSCQSQKKPASFRPTMRGFLLYPALTDF